MNKLLTIFVRYLHPKSSVAFWHTPIGPVRYQYPTLSNYYIDLRAKINYKGPYDSEGIPILDYFGKIGKQYNPCAIAQWGLGAWQRWQEGDAKAQETFFRAANWLSTQIEVDNRGRGYWWYRFDFDAYNQRAPWASALAQAQGVSVLLRAYLTRGDVHYREIAAKAVTSMLTPVAEGGLLLKHGENVFLEEIVADRPTAILDGLIFALFGLQDYCYVFKDDVLAAQILQDGYETIKRILPQYDLGYWSRADLYSVTPVMPASIFYHSLHVAQLQILSDITEDALFQDYAQRWLGYNRSPLKRCRAIVNKTAFKLLHY